MKPLYKTNRYKCDYCDFDTDTAETDGHGFRKCPNCKRLFKLYEIYKEFWTGEVKEYENKDSNA